MYRNELIAANIRRIKAEKGLKSNEIAERVGIQTGRMAKYERGELNVSIFHTSIRQPRPAHLQHP